MSTEERLKSYLLSKSPNKVVKLISECQSLPTCCVAACLEDSKGDVRFRSRLVKAGLVEVLLGFLNQCATSSFDQIKKDHGDGDLECPSLWFRALIDMIGPGCLPESQLEETRKLIARRIQPLAECMADPKEELFLSRDWWLANLFNFANILKVLTTFSSSTMPILRENQAVVRFSVQAIFLEQYRNDLVPALRNLQQREASIPIQPGFWDLLRLYASQVMEEFCKVDGCVTEGGSFSISDENAARLKQLACVRVVNANANGTTEENLTFAPALLDLLVAEIDSSTRISLGFVAKQLAVTDCLGKEAIVKLVRIGQYSKTPKFSDFIGEAIASCLCRHAEPNPDDGRVALAVEAGLVEMCLQTEMKYGDTDGVVSPRLKSRIVEILKLVGFAAMFRKSGKAIRDRADIIRDVADSVLERNGDATSELILIVRAIVDKAEHTGQNQDERDQIVKTRTKTCSWCRTQIEPGQSNHCGHCRVVIYCSQECQTRDWKEGGHKQTCEMINERVKGRGEPSRKEKRQLWDLIAAGRMLFADNVGPALLQATLIGQDISDCVVWLDFRQTPPLIRTKPASWFLEVQKLDELARRDLSLNQQSGKVTLVSDGPSAKGIVLRVYDSLTSPEGTPWNETQQMVNEENDAWLEQFRRDPELVNEALVKLSQATGACKSRELSGD